MTNAVTYSRVSTQEQRQHGYSLRQQKEALRAYCLGEGWEIVAEVEDGGQSGASFERPGLDRVRDLVAGGGIDLVVAQDRDRFAREPAYLYLLKKEFSEQGTRLRALNDRGDDSPEGELTDGILDQLAKFERAKIAERSRRGKMQKAREGRLIAGHTPNYGFRYNGGRDGYVVHEPEMEVVRRIFRMVGAEGASMHGVRKALDREGVPTPQTPRKAKRPEERRWWSKRTIRDIIEDDCYRPHSHEEIALHLAPDVAARLDPEASYGVWWFGRRHTTHERVAEVGADGTREYRLRQKTVVKPREQWIAVPVPDAGVPGALVEAARARIKDRVPTPSSGDRLYELRGVLFCGDCGSRMVTNRVLQPGTKRPAHYYRCPKRQHFGKEACPNGRHLRAEGVEGMVWEAVERGLSEPQALSRQYDRLLERMREGMRRDPDREMAAYANRLADVERRRAAFQDMAAEGLISFGELRAKLAGLDEVRGAAEAEVEKLRGARERLEFMEQERDYVLGELARVSNGAGEDMTPDDKARQYRGMGLKALADREGNVELTGGMFVEWGPSSR